MDFFIGVIVAAEKTFVKDVIKAPLDITPLFVLAESEDQAAVKFRELALEKHSIKSNKHIHILTYSLNDAESQDVIKLADMKKQVMSEITEISEANN